MNRWWSNKVKAAAYRSFSTHHVGHLPDRACVVECMGFPAKTFSIWLGADWLRTKNGSRRTWSLPWNAQAHLDTLPSVQAEGAREAVPVGYGQVAA
jgi:hypothetical protein